MKENFSYKLRDIKSVKNELEKQIIRGIIEYARNGTLPNNNPNTYLKAYSIIQYLADLGDSESNAIFNYHNSIIQNFIEDSYKILSKESSEQLLDSFIKQTEKINFVIYWMNKIFTYLDRFYTTAKSKGSLSQNALRLYRDYLFNLLQYDIYIEVNKLIKQDRNGNTESRYTIKIILKILNDIDLICPKIIKENNKISWIPDNRSKEKYNYCTDYGDRWYEDSFRDETIKYARDKGKIDIHSMSAPKYILSQLKYLNEEKIRQKEYINSRYHSKINEINYKYLIGENAEEISKMDTGISFMFNAKKYEELKNTYQLFKLYPPSLKVIISSFQLYIIKRGEEISQNKEITKDPKKFIPQLISFKKEMDNLVLECFENHPQFQDNENMAFSLFTTKDIYFIQLSNYIDFCMRKGFKGKTQEEIENTLNNIIDLYKCLNEKLAFKLEANKKMSDRLIKNLSISINAEKYFISKLCQESGVIYVNNMTEMINDLERNKKEKDEYKLSESKGAPNGIKFNIQVISPSPWVINKKLMEKIEMPKFLSTSLKDFEQFYLKRHYGQKLIWCLGLSKLDIQYLYLKNKNISISTLPQFLILLQLEKYGTLTIKQIAENLGCQISTIISDINGLVFNPSYNPQGKAEKGVIVGTFNSQKIDFKETDKISINKFFIVSSLKFSTIPLALKQSSEEIRKNELEEAKIHQLYRDDILESTITRIMKSRIGEIITHDWIINKVLEEIDLFTAKKQEIRDSIEKLIKKNIIIKRLDKDEICYEFIY